MKRFPSNAAYALLIGALCGLAVQAAHLFTLRVHVNLDQRMHYNYAREYAAAMAGGDFWPRWAMQAQDGLGEPGLLYYAPLYYWITGLIDFLTGNVWLAMQITEIAASALLGLFAFKLAADHMPARRALWAPLIACSSSMLVMLQVGFNGYPWACATAPLAAYFWALLRPGTDRRWLNIPAMIALAVVVVTHTVTGLMAVIVTAPIGLSGLIDTRGLRLDWQRLLAPAITITGGLALSAFYLLPGVSLQSLIDSAVWRQNFTPYNAFSLSTVTAWHFGVRWFAFQWPISLAIIAGTLLGLGLLWRRREAPPSAIRLPITLIAGTAVFLSLELSYPLWLIDSPLRNIQFPHRFMTILVPLLPLIGLAAIAGHADDGRIERLGKRLLAVVLAGGVLLGLALAAKAMILDGARMDFREQGFGGYAGLDEYRTRWTPDTPAARQLALTGNDCANGRLACGTKARADGAIRWPIAARERGSYLLPFHYFPTFRLTIDDRPASLRHDDRSGLIVVDLPAGPHVLKLKWQPLPNERAGLGITLAMTLALLLAGAVRRRRMPLR